MIESLRLIFERLLATVSTDYYRYLYPQLDLNSRLTGILGARGVGKTTLMLQYIKNNFSTGISRVFYFSADHIYFTKTTLYEFVEDLYLTNHTTIFFIDEIHKYKNWSQELKNLYDGFPELQIVFSGSSSLDLVKGSYDLSRRARILKLEGLSFREYINFNGDFKMELVSLTDLIDQKHSLNRLIAQLPAAKGLFEQYLRKGFYPFVREESLDYYERILRIIDKTIYEDIASYYQLNTENLSLFRKILNFLVSIPPGKISIHNLSKNLSVDHKTISNYLRYLKETGLINMVYPAEAGNQSLRRVEKAFLNNTNLQYALEGHIASGVDLGNMRELYFVQALTSAGIAVYHSKQGDFQAKNFTFEIGGKNKTRHQIQTLDHAILVKDNIMTSTPGIIPLMFFGFLY